MRKLTKEQIAARKRLLEDFEFWAKHSCKIRTKSGEIVSLELNKVQKRLLARIDDQLRTQGKIRLVILKGRQQGFSTVVSAYIYWWTSQHKGQKGIVIAHVKDSTQTLFDMYGRIHKNIPEMLKPSTKYSSKREIVFDALDSGLMVATAGGDAIARGETLQCMHLSELAFWPKNFANENFNGLIQALPDAPGTMCFVECTANGVTGKFYDLWQGAVAGHNGFEPFFSAWFESDEYRETPPDGFTLTPEEVELAEKHGLDGAQLYWRRRKIANNGLELFKQEYPCTADEAFITSGRPVFHTETIVELKDRAPYPLTRMAVEPFTDDKGLVSHKVVEHPRGELLVYRKREENETYYIGADVSVGIKDPEKSDWCVAQVLDSAKRQVAMWRGQVTPDHYARVLNALGYYYNIAMIAPERNGHGLLVCVRLWKDLDYPNCFFDLKEGDIADKETLAIGFQTNVSSKPLIIDKLRGEVREREIEIYDQTTLAEMLSFVVTETGKMEAEQGCYDDTVMALAIANHIHEGKWMPVNVTDDYYVNAI
jgi:hypothetical protein